MPETWIKVRVFWMLDLASMLQYGVFRPGCSAVACTHVAEMGGSLNVHIPDRCEGFTISCPASFRGSRMARSSCLLLTGTGENSSGCGAGLTGESGCILEESLPFLFLPCCGRRSNTLPDHAVSIQILSAWARWRQGSPWSPRNWASSGCLCQ